MEILEEIEKRDLANGAVLHWGGVDGLCHLFKKVRVADDKEVGVYPLDLPE